MRTQKYNLQGIKVFFYILMIAILGWFLCMQFFGANEQENDVQSQSPVYTGTFYWEKEDGSKQKIKTAFKKRGFLCGYKPLLPARVSRRCFHFVQAIAFDSRQPSKGFIFYYFFLLAFSCLYACYSASENGFAYSFTLILSIAISCISCSRIYFATVASFNPTVLT